MTTEDFKVVSDDLRAQTRAGTEQSALVKALLDDKTVFLPLNGRTPGNMRGAWEATVKRHGRKFHMRQMEVDGVKGVVVWASLAEPAA